MVLVMAFGRHQAKILHFSYGVVFVFSSLLAVTDLCAWVELKCGKRKQAQEKKNKVVLIYVSYYSTKCRKRLHYVWFFLHFPLLCFL